jgi:hypothetical protein
VKTWMPGTSPGMTNSGESTYFIDRILSQTLRSLPTGLREARPDDKLRKRLEG